MCEQIAGIPTLVGDAVVRLLAYVDRVTKLSPHANVISGMQSVVSRALSKVFKVARLSRRSKERCRTVYQSPQT